MDEKRSTQTAVDKFMHIIGWLQNLFSVIPLVLMCFIVLISVIMRYALKIPFTWGEEAARYLMIFAAMLAIGMGVREKAHNIGLPILECQEAAAEIRAGDQLKVDLAAGTIQNLTQDRVYQAGGFPPFLQKMIDAGGLLACLSAENETDEGGLS